LKGGEINMDSLEIIKKYLTPEVPFKLKNQEGKEDIIYLKPLNIAQRIQLSEIYKKLSKFKEGDIDNEVSIELFDLYKSIIKRIIPEIEEEQLENFVLSNSTDLFNVLPGLIPKSKNQEKVELIKKKIEERQKTEEENK